MAFANLADVKIALRIKSSDQDTDRDAQLQASLDAVDAWARKWFPLADVSGAKTVKFFDIYENATLRLPTRDCTVTAVRVFPYPSSGFDFGVLNLTEGNGWEVDDRANLILRPVMSFQPFEGALATRTLRSYGRVEVDVTLTGTVPADLKEGIAFLAAGYWKNGPAILADLMMERIGDYEYRKHPKTDGEPDYVGQAMFFLKPYLSDRARVSVT